MQSTTHSTSLKSARPLVVLTVFALVLTAVAVCGCGAAASPGAEAPKTPVTSASTPAADGVTTALEVQTCLECGKKTMPPRVVGGPAVDSGVQVIGISIVGGTYSPNVITASAGTPIKVVFTGSAKGCLAKPKFGALNKGLDITTSGAGTIDLGTLKPGVYEFTCGMGMNKGTITVQ